jgi:IclR family pca regulon transcriptional regulator
VLDRRPGPGPGRRGGGGREHPRARGPHPLESVRRELLPQLLTAVAAIEADLRITDPARAASPGSARHR